METTRMDAGEARQAVAETGRELLAEGLVARTWGNVSCRVDLDRFAITPSGLGYDRMTAEDVVLCRLSDKKWEGARKPSSERGVHAAAYRRFPDAGFVIHTHQCYASALSLAGFDRLNALPEAERAPLGGVALAGYGLPGTGKLVRAVDRALETGAHCVLMAHHGALLIGRDREEALFRARTLERLARTVVRGQPEGEAGNPVRLQELTQHAGTVFGRTACTSDPAVIAASRLGAIPAQLDDAAQMIGEKIASASAEEDPLLIALQRCNAVLVTGLGGVCRAKTDEDLAALKLLMQKSSVAFLHARASGVNAKLSEFDTALMRCVYVLKYKKKIGG